MKIRESGMPDESMWNDFFNIEMILSELEINSDIDDMVEIGSGYGTFTIPVSKRIKGTLFTFDIETKMLEILTEKLNKEKRENIKTEKRDVIKNTTGLPDSSMDYFMLFNILHNEDPDVLLNEAQRILKPEGKIGIIHWRSDIETPRGPDLSIRPTPEEIIHWVNKDHFSTERPSILLPPYHFGLVFSKR